MKTFLNWIGLLIVLGSPVAAQSLQSVSSAPSKTYNWMVPDMKNAQNPMYSNSFARQRIQQAFDQALREKGFTRNTSNPDFLLQFHTFTQRVRKNYNGGGYGMMPWYGFGRFGWGMPFGYPGYYGGGYPYSTTSTNGTLILDITNPKTGEIVWQKAITGDVSNLNRLEKQIGKGVRKMMKSFPAQGV